MAASIEVQIWMALKRAVQSAAGNIPVAWPGTNYEPGGAPFLSVSEVITPPERVLVEDDGPHERSGVLAMVLRTPLRGMVYETQKEQASQIANMFTDGLKLRFSGTCVRITRKAEIGGGFRDGAWWHTPINVPWEVYA